MISQCGTASVLVLFIIGIILFGPIHYERHAIGNNHGRLQSSLLQNVKSPHQATCLTHGCVRYHLSSTDVNIPLTVLVHGLAGPMEVFDPLVKRISSRRILTFDLYGRGPSDVVGFDLATAAGMDLYANQLVELLYQLNITGRFDLVGLSMGGAVASRFAEIHGHSRVRTLTLLAPAGTSAVTESSISMIMIQSAVRMLNRFSLLFITEQVVSTLVVKNFEREMVGTPTPEALEFLKACASQSSSKLAVMVSSSLLAMKQARMLQTYRALNVCRIPILLIWGRQDKVTPLDTWGKELENELLASRKKCSTANSPVRLTVIEKAAHFAVVEKVDEVAGEMIRFWAHNA